MIPFRILICVHAINVLQLLYSVVVCKTTTHHVTLTALSYNVKISDRLSETRVQATVVNQQNTTRTHSIELTIPGSALLSSFFIESNGKNYTSTVMPASKDPKRDDASENLFKLHTRLGESQKLKMVLTLFAGEKITINYGYTCVLKRTRGLYQLILYKSSTMKYEELNIDIDVIMSNEIRKISFLQTYGSEEPLEVISTGKAVIYYHNGKRITLQYQFNHESGSQFESVEHHTIAYKPNFQRNSSVSFNPLEIPKTFLADPALVFSFDIERYGDGGDLQIQNQYFAHFLSPEGLEKLPVHTIFTIDVSGSMDESRKLSNLKVAMRTILQSLKKEDSFQIFVFSTNLRSLGIYNGSSEQINNGIYEVSQLKAYGGTNINDALLGSVQSANKHRHARGTKQILFLTDGRSTVGETNSLKIRRTILEINIRQIPIYTIAFGNDADIKFLRQMSRENGGYARKIRSEGRPAVQMKGFYEEISTPLLTNISLKYPRVGVKNNSVVRPRTTRFYSGEEIIVAGKLRKSTSLFEPVVSGIGSNGRLQLKVSRKRILETPSPDNPGVVRRIWAYLAVKDMISRLELEEDEDLKFEIRTIALAVALEHNFLTHITSMVIDDPIPIVLSSDDNSENLYPYDSVSPVYASVLSVTELRLVRPEDFTASLPERFQNSVPLALSRRFSFVDNDPHFVVEVSGLPLPICFDLHGQPGDTLNLMRDQVSGLIVNAEVSAALDKPGATYFTTIYIHLNRMNLTITTDSITIQFVPGHDWNQVSKIDNELYFNTNKNTRDTESSKLWNHKRRHQRRLSDKKLTQNKCIQDATFIMERNRNEAREENTNVFNSNDPLIDIFFKRNYKKHPNKAKAHLTNIPTFNSKEVVVEFSAEENKLAKNKIKADGNYLLNFTKTNQVNNKFNSSTFNSLQRAKIHNENSGCFQTYTWEHFGQKRYENIVLTVRGRRRRRRLDVLVGDIRLHVAITKSKKRNGQNFLGFYIQKQNVLSLNTSGIIGQFVFKSIGTLGHYPELVSNPKTLLNKIIPLLVVHGREKGMERRLTKVVSVVSKRRSLLHREKVLCLHVKKHGRGLLAHKYKHYLVNSLHN